GQSRAFCLRKTLCPRAGGGPPTISFSIERRFRDESSPPARIYGTGNRNNKMPKVLISDKMDPRAAEIFRERGVEVDEITGLSPEELMKIIGEYDGLAIRSSTTVTPEILNAATNLKVVGRAGIGVDNVDIPAASAKGVVVMNTPFG